MKCLCEDPLTSRISVSVAVVNGREQVQETCSVCGHGSAHTRDTVPSLEPLDESGEAVVVKLYQKWAAEEVKGG